MTAVRPTSVLSCARVGLAAMLGLLLASCAATPEVHRVSLPRVAPSSSPAPVASSRERLRILGSYGGVYENARLQQLIGKTVDRLTAASERPDLRYNVTILNSPAVNAFALPDGELFVTRGLIALANDESELASVLSHEMGHVIAHHAEIREDKARQAALISHVVSDVLSDPQTGALALAKSKLALASFSRAQEFEADGIGVGIAARAGFDPYGAARFLSDMQRNADVKGGGDERRSFDFLAAHPATPDRIRNARQNARKFTAPGGGKRDRAEYLSDLDGMVYGEDPSEGFVRGRRFLHSKLGFTFVAPPGFTLDNTAQAVLGLNDGGGEALRLDVVKVPAEQSLADYLKSGWIENVDADSVKEFTVNGFPAASASAKGNEWAFRLYAVRFGSDVYRFIFAARKMNESIDRAFRASIESFRRMSLAESRQVKPLHIKIVTVAPGDTVDALASRMAVADRKRERFLVLNGLGPLDSVKAGENVKMVVE